MLTQAIGVVAQVTDWDGDAQELEVSAQAETGPQAPQRGHSCLRALTRALNYIALTGPVQVGDTVLLNTTAKALKLGTGGYDFVIANLTRPLPPPLLRAGGLAPPLLGAGGPPGHIVKGRYLPCQNAVLTLEEQEQYAEVWEKTLDGMPVLVGQLHSQVAPAAAALHLTGKQRVAYLMTDQAALPLAFSRLARDLKAAGLIAATLTCGQAFGGDYETVTVHSALLAARHILYCDAAIVCQGPGNAGTGTKYGFSGIEQAQNLDIAKALGGTAIAIVRISSADPRARHQGISHHTRTALDLAYARCVVPVPAGTDIRSLPPGHDVRFVEGGQAALDLLAERGVRVTSMGRTPAEDPAFFLAAAAAGMVAV